MNVADLLLIVGSVSGIASLIIQARRDRNKPIVDESEASKNFADTIVVLNKQLAENGKSFKDLFNELAELPQLRAEIKVARSEISELKRQSTFWLSFARAYHTGAQINADFIRKLEHVPPYEPPKFPTGPLPTGSAAS